MKLGLSNPVRMARPRPLTGTHDRMDQALLRAFLPRPPLLDVGLRLELERIHRRRAAGVLDQADVDRLIERAHDALDAALERIEQEPSFWFECISCRMVASVEMHAPWCPELSR